MSRKHLDRRTFLRGVGGVAVGLPFLEIMGGCSRRERELEPVGSPLGSVRQQSSGYPTRLIVVFSANGTIPSTWTPSGGETDFVMSPILAPLERHRDKLLIIQGLDMISSRNGPGDAHMKGMGHVLTGTELLEGNEFTGGGDPAPQSGWGGGVSIDQAAANQIGLTTKFGSLELGVQVGGATIWSRMSYRAPDQPVPPESDPYAAFDRIFADHTTDQAELARIRAKRQSALDFVRDDYQRLVPELGQVDRERVDRHLTAVREVESRLSAGGGILSEACVIPDLGPRIDTRNNDNYPQIGRLQMDLLAMSIACDLTRVASLQWSRSVSGTRFSWLNIPEGHHDLSHYGDSEQTADGRLAADKLTDINRWYAEQFAYLLDLLDSYPEGDGTVLDHSAVLWVNELGKGNSHTRNDVPFVLAGGANGYFRTGRFLQYPGDVHHNDLLVSVLNAVGINVSTFGNPAYCTGPLTNLT